MSYAIIRNNVPVELRPGASIESKGVQFSYDTMQLWSDAERKTKDIYTIVDPGIPSGKMSTGSSLSFANGVVTRTWTLADAPAPVILTNKADVWRRATDDERLMLDGALSDAPAYLRQLYNAITIIDHSAPEFPALRDAVANTSIGNGIIGYTRADELLAASTG